MALGKGPYSGFRFVVLFDQLEAAGFSKVRGLSRETRIESFREGGVNDHEHKLASLTSYGNLVLERGLADPLLYAWHQAVVEGQVKGEDFSIRSYLAENAAFRVYSTRKKGEGKLAITHVRVVKRNPKTTRVQVRLETGRKHQIRVHLAERGHPIVGDKAYGSPSNPIRRLALHGEYLSFRHPVTGKRVEFEAKYPSTFEAL